MKLVLRLICNIFKNVNSYRRKTLQQTIHTGEEPYIYDIIIVRLIKA